MSVQGSARRSREAALRRARVPGAGRAGLGPAPRRAGPALLALWVLLAAGGLSRADALDDWLRGLAEPPLRDAPALVALRRASPELMARLLSAAQSDAPQTRAAALLTLGALGEDPAALAHLSGPLVRAAQARIAARTRLRARLLQGLSPAQAAALDPPEAACLRELAGDPLGGAERAAALEALGGRAEGRETLRRVCSAGGPAALHAARGLSALGDEAGLSAALPAALERLEGPLARELLAGIARVSAELPLARCRAYLLGAGSDAAKAVLARSLAELGWREAAGALRRLAREPDLERAALVTVLSAYLRLGGAPAELSLEAPALLAAACSESEAGASQSAEEAFVGLTHLAPEAAASALTSVLQRPDPLGVRRARAIHAAEALGLAALAPVLRDLARDLSQPTLARAAAAHALGGFGGSEDQAALLALAQDASPALRRAALAALRRVASPARIGACGPAFALALRDAEPAVRRVALGALGSAQDLARLEAALSSSPPALSDPDECLTWLEVAASLGLKSPGPAAWLLARWSARPDLRRDAALAQATLAFARGLSAEVAVPALLELLEHSLKEAAKGAHEALAERYPSGADFGGDPARWRRAWREQPALFR